MSKGGVLGSAQSGADRYRRRLLAAAGLSNNLLLSNLNTTVTIKSSPAKSAEETGRLGIISGFLTKRNEQHSWQRRFCALVPQSFLYYFEDESADSPRGIIDLEFYTDISAQPNNVVKLATADGSHRTFYFQADSEEEMNAWLSALIRERYFHVRDERDAYQELQKDFQAQSAADQDEMKRVVAERYAVLALEERALREEAEVAHQLNELLTSVDGVVELDAPSASTEAISDMAVAALEGGGRALVRRVAELEARLEQSKSGAARLEEELRDYQDQLRSAAAELEVEAKALAREQKLKAAEMADVAGLRAELEEGEVNLGIIERTKRSADDRVSELSEQKKLLVREVKAARKLLAEKKRLLAKADPRDSPPPPDDPRRDVSSSLESSLDDDPPRLVAAEAEHSSPYRLLNNAASKLLDNLAKPTPHARKPTLLSAAAAAASPDDDDDRGDPDPAAAAAALPAFPLDDDLTDDDAALSVVDLLLRAQFAKSKGEARRLIAQGGARLQDVKVSDTDALLSRADFAAAPQGTIKLSAGKKKHAILTLGAPPPSPETAATTDSLAPAPAP
mmetsp:Transcript_2362/g.7285  ORF Transcript_2362/g.7285 Transcript_2362/m.7285 type:complete len:566 (-) Transcript_2362:91-1788(-)